MRNLYFKVFALILGSAVILFAVVAGLFAFLDHERGEELVYAAAHAAVAAYERGERGRRGEPRTLRRAGLRTYLLDGHGRALGRPLPPPLRERLIRPPQVFTMRTPRGHYTVRTVAVRGTSGRDYQLVAVGDIRIAHLQWLWHPAARVVLPLLIIALASLLISRLITRPLGGLKGATQRFSGGVLSARAPRALTRRNDAFGELAREFDRMSERIEQLVAEHRRLLRDVSHELRSPLSRMQVAATLLEDRTDRTAHAHPAHPARPAHLARIQREIARLDALIDQLLSLTRLHAGAVELQRTEVELGALLREVAHDAAYEFAAQGKEVEVTGGAITVHADAAQLASAFENVIRNGLRYARRRLHVEVAAHGAAARICITDDGAGVPPQHLAHLFEPFYRPDPSRTEATGSAGIGLAIAKGVLTAHGGAITAANTMGGGLMVTMELPRRG